MRCQYDGAPDCQHRECPTAHHPSRCGPYCAIQHCTCGVPADHGTKVCSKCARGVPIR
jgi:hypothetical protein